MKRQKNDAADAEAICEAVQRPNMRFVTVKSEEQQASALVFRTRDLLVRQRTQTINAIRGHMTEYGWVAPKGPSWVTKLGDLIDDEANTSLPQAAREMFRVMLSMLKELSRQIVDLDKEIARRAREDEVARRLMIIPGIGPIADHRQQCCCAPSQQARCERRFVACSNAGSQASHAGNCGPGEQDSQNSLGTACEAGRLQGSGGNGGIKPPKSPEVVGRCSRSKEGMAQQSARRGQKTRPLQCAQSTRT